MLKHSTPIKIENKKTININSTNKLNKQTSNDIIYSSFNLPPSDPFVFTPPDDSSFKLMYLNYMEKINK